MTSASHTRRTALERLLAPWVLRGAVGLLLFAAWELMLGRSITTRDIVDLFTLLASALAVSTLMLDLMERFAVRDGFALLLVAGIGGLFAFALLDMRPSNDVFLALSSRGLGAFTLSALAMIASLLWIARLGPWSLLWVSGTLGLVAGLWVRWMPYETVPAAEGWLSLIAAPLLWIGGVHLARLSTTSGRAQLRLSLSEALAAMGLVIVGVTARSDASLPPPLTAMIAGTLIVLCLVMLWFQRRRKGETYIERLLGWHPNALKGAIPAPRRLFAWVAVFSGAALIGWLVPRGTGSTDPIAIIGTLLSAFGLVWLPTVALVYGWRAVRRDVRAQRL